MSAVLVLLLQANSLALDDGPPAPPDQLAVWVVNPLVRAFRDSQPPENPVTELRLAALRNEYESAQIAVRAAATTRASVSVGPLALQGGDRRLPPDCVTVRTVGYVPVGRNTPDTPATELDRIAPADFPDPLLPGPSASLVPGNTQPFWITLRVPADATPGIYRGEVRVTSGLGSAMVPLELRVWASCLPDERHLWLTNWISPNALSRFLGVEPWSEGFWEALPAYARNMAEHRQNVILTSLELILATRAKDGTLSFSFERFDRWVGIFTDAGVVGLIEGGHVAKRKGKWTSPVFEFRPIKALNDAKPPAPSAADAKALLTALRDHLREKGWLDRYVQHVADEPTQYNYLSWLKLSTQIHQWVPDFRRLDALHSPKLSGQLEVWVPQLDILDQQRAAFEAERDQRGAELWFYTCMYPRGAYANRLIDYPLTKTRALPWLVRRLGCRGYLHWGYNFWSEKPFEDVERSSLPPGDSFIVYPGKDGPLDSLRWEILREGIEDYETLLLLDQSGAGDIADMLCKRLADGPTTFERDPDRYYQARDAAHAELERRLRPARGDPETASLPPDGRAPGYPPNASTVSRSPSAKGTFGS